jgi:aspartyl-tRNA(Asn)/glutamyl-tRNA(Gln) amidotransferase subunit B
VRAALPELPQARAARYRAEGVGVAESEVLTDEPALADLFDRCRPHYPDADRLAKRITNEVASALHAAALTPESQRATPEAIGQLLSMVDRGELSGAASKEVLAELVVRGGDPSRIAEALGLQQVSDRAPTEAALARVLDRSAAEVARYRSGKTQLLGFFVGQVMKEMKGQGNPALIAELVKERLG